MTTPTPLDQQRQLVRSFVTADRQRSERETTAQQQFAAGEKAATEQRAASERTAQQQYAAGEKSAEQQYSAAIKQADDEKSRQQRQLQDAANTIGNGWSVAVTDLDALGVPAHDLPLQLNKTSPRASSAGAGVQPLLQFQANATQIARLYQEAGQLLLAHGRQQALRRKLLITAAVVAVILAVAGYFGFQKWSYDQRLSSSFRAALTALEAGDWETAHKKLGEVQRGQPDYILHRKDELVASNRRASDTTGLAINPEDGAIYIYVPAGEFLMGSPENLGNLNEHPQHMVYLDGYWIMQTEVTNAQYARCVTSGACSSPNNGDWQSAEKANHPVTNVSWEQAQEYALWLGGRLPSEAEWEKAARGIDGRTYPWGESAPNGNKVNCCHLQNGTAPVGSYLSGASPYGILDMAGNVSEWTGDWYDQDYYSRSPMQSPSGPSSGSRRVIRGGSYSNVRPCFCAKLRIFYSITQTEGISTRL